MYHIIYSILKGRLHTTHVVGDLIEANKLFNEKMKCEGHLLVEILRFGSLQPEST